MRWGWEEELLVAESVSSEQKLQVRLGHFPRGSETPLGKSLTAVPAKGAQKWNGSHTARQEEAGSAERKMKCFRGIWRPPTSMLDTRWGVFGFWVGSLLLQGKFSLAASTYLPAC